MLEQTLELARRGNWSVRILPPVADIDELSDLERLRALLADSSDLRALLPHTCSQLLDNTPTLEEK